MTNATKELIVKKTSRIVRAMGFVPEDILASKKQVTVVIDAPIRQVSNAVRELYGNPKREWDEDGTAALRTYSTEQGHVYVSMDRSLPPTQRRSVVTFSKQ